MALARPIIVKTEVQGQPLFINLNNICSMGVQSNEAGEREFVMFNLVSYAVRVVIGKDISEEEAGRIMSIFEQLTYTNERITSDN